jgi:hypothetical protein
MDVELVREPPRPAQSKPETTAGAESVAHRQFDVRNAASMVFKCQAETASSAFFDAFDGHVSAAPVLHRIPCEFTRRRHDFGLVDQVEPDFHRALTNGLADGDNIFGRLDGSMVTKKDRHCGGAP